jgi:TonB family protein
MNRLLSFASWLLLFAVAVAPRTSLASAPAEAWRDFVIEQHWPEYSIYARGYGYTGEGRYTLEIDLETGKVIGVTILKSTTHKMLDDAAVFALRRWRFRPHVNQAAIIPVTFSLQGRPRDEAQHLAVYCVEPDLPVTWHRGSGSYRFNVDYETGRITEVKIVKSSGLPKFDEAVLKAYRQWRFPPHTIRSIDETMVVKPL